MATFEDTVDKLGKTTEKLDRAADKMSAASKEDTGAAAKEEANEARRQSAETNSHLKQIASVLTGMEGRFELDAAKGKLSKAGGIFAGIANAIGGIGAGIGKGVGGFMAGIGKAAVFAPKFVIAMGALGLGLGAFILAIGGSARLVSEVFPGLAENLKSFEGINGKNLVQVGLGMAAIGVGLGAQGLGGAISSVSGLIGGIADGIGGILGIKSGPESTLEKMKLFGEAKINAKGVKANAEAMRAYGVAMAAGGGGQMLEGLGKLGSGVFGSLGKMLGAVPPLEAMQKFGEAKVNHKGVKDNAASMVSYLEAMAVGSGASVMSAVGSLGSAVGSIMDGVGKLFGGKSFIDTTIENMKKLSAVTLNRPNISNFASAMVDYLKIQTLGAGAEAMKAVGSAGNAISSFMDGVSKLFGGKTSLDSQIEGLQKLSVAGGTISLPNVKNTADAMVHYAKAMAVGAAGEAGKAGGAIGNLVSNIGNGLSRFLGGKESSPIDDLKKFAETVITSEQLAQIKINSEALLAYGAGMAKFAGMQVLKGGGDLLSGISKGLSSFFGREEKVKPLEALQSFAEKMIDVPTVENNVKALHAFAQLGLNYKQNKGMESFVKDMSENLPKIEGLINGVEATGAKVLGIRVGSEGFKGLASPDVNYQEAANNIEKLKALVNVDMSAPSPDQQSAEAKTNMMWAEGLQNAISGLAQTIANVNTGGNVSSQSNVTNLASPHNSPVNNKPKPGTSRMSGTAMSSPF